MRFLLVFLSLLVCLPVRAEPAKPVSERDRMSYSLGHDLGANYKRQAMDVDPAMVARGLADALSGTAPDMSEAEMAKARTELRRLSQAALREQAEKVAATKRAAGRAFLEVNAGKAGIVSLPSGLQYRVIKLGEGVKPGPADSVTVHYKGTLLDGSEFDSSYRRNQPASFPLNGVIAGWTEGLQFMQPGAKHELFIPPDLAYGKRGRLADETLVFEVELISVETAKKTD